MQLPALFRRRAIDGGATGAPALPALASDGLQNVVAGLGTDRDKSSYSGYAPVLALSRADLENMWRGSWLAARIVSVPAEDMTRAWRAITFDTEALPEDRVEELRESVEREERRLRVRERVHEALLWARLYGGAALLLGCDGDPATPLDPASIGQGGLRYLHVVDRWRLGGSGQITTDLASPNFGLPESYTLSADGGSALRVHWSRLIRVDGARLPWSSWRANAMWHDSVLQAPYDAVRRMDQASGGVATMLWEANVDVISGGEISKLLSQRDGEAKLTKRFQLAALMKSFNRMLLLDGDEKYEKRGNTFAGLDKVLQAFQTETAAAAGMPVTKLWGQSPGGLNATGDSDTRNYYDGISAAQERDLRPVLERLDQLLLRSALGTLPPDAGFVFEPLWQLDEVQRAAAELQRAQRDQIYLATGAATPGLVARELRERGTYREMSEADVSAAEGEGERRKKAAGQQGQPAGAAQQDNAQ